MTFHTSDSAWTSGWLMLVVFGLGFLLGAGCGVAACRLWGKCVGG